MESQLDDRIIQEHRLEIMTHGRAVFRRVVNNTDRAIGTRLSGELSQLHGQGLFKGNIQYRMTGVAGQSMGAYLVDGIELRLKGIANDYVGKGMNGGLITIRLDKQVRDRRKNMTIIGNTALYGATGGRIHIAGKAGERFAVRNSGATAVVEGIGNHGCEYMTRGTIIVLDSIGQNFGAGMTGGIAFLYSKTKSNLDNLNKNYVKTTELHEDDELLILRLLRSHRFHTRSHIAKDIITHWNKEKIHFSKIVPKAMEIINLDKIYNQQASYRMGVLLNE
jgi:glutamate synthase domain-containing protein 3